MARLLSRLASLVWWSLLVLLVLLAATAAIGRQLSGHVNAWKDELATALSEQTGLEVAIGRLDSRWYWLDPTLIATDLTLHSADSATLDAELEYLRLRLDFWSSVRRQRLVFEDLEADGLALTLVKPGNLPVETAAEELAPFLESGERPDWLVLAGQWLSDPQARVTRVSIAVGNSPEDLRDFYLPQVDLAYHRGLFQANGRAMQSGTARELASFALVGQHFFRGDFTGQVYLDVASGRLFDGLVDDLNWRDIRVEGFDLGGQAWATFDGGELAEVKGQLNTPYLQLGAGPQSLAPLENIEANFGWRPGRALMLEGLRWTWLDTDVEPFNLRLQQGGLEGVALAADQLALAPLRSLAGLLPLLPDEALRALENYRPSGYLDDFYLQLPEDTSKFRLTTRLRDVSVQAYDGAPGGSGVHGYLQLDAGGGFIELDSDHSATIGFPQLFNTDWTFSEPAGRVSWQLDGPITRVYAGDLSMTYREDTRLTGGFDLRLDKLGEDNLGLRVGVKNADASRIGEFVPAKVVNEGLYGWLTDSIRGGRVTAGKYYGHGRIDRNAPNGSFTSSMWYEFDDGQVRYDPAWPEATGVAGRVQVHNESALIRLESGRTGGLAVGPVEVVLIPGTGSESSVLKVQASPEATGANVSWWLANTPLGDWGGETLQQADITGDYRLALDLDIPLAEGAEPTVQVRAQTDNGGFRLAGNGPAWTDITGDLTYHTHNGFSGDPVRSRFLDQPVTIELDTADNGQGLDIRQTGRLPMPEFLWQMGLDNTRTLNMAGTLDYRADVRIADTPQPKVTLRSDLSGLALDWPEPLAKSADQTTELSATLDAFAEGGLRLNGQWQDRLAFDWRQTASGFEARLENLRLEGHELNLIDIRALDLGSRWVVHTDSERATGRFSLPVNGGVIEADLQELQLGRSNGGQTDADIELLTLDEQLEAFRALEIGRWPDIDVRIARLILGGEPAGSWRFAMRPQPGRLRVEGINGQLGSLELQGALQWAIMDGRETSRFQGVLSGGALRDLEALTGNPIPVNNNETEIQLDLDWPGGPNNLQTSRLNGSIRGRLDDGVILEQSGSAQLFRVFNLLNTDTLWRRLQLDFSDLYEAGVAFDAISGKANIDNGVVTLDPELQLVGPSGAFKLSGTTDMADESLDMRLVVVLPVTQNLPLAAVLLGAGAPVGGALFVLDKLLGDPLSRLTSATYDVTGSWDDPKVDLRGVFDTE
ncbi:MAG: hypothetical protein HLX50_07660 [Alteromonadaceae bacterium]|nr:hypothetical protein [Alteromonadaceae bacterium]